jgi:hypothetical protein
MQNQTEPSSKPWWKYPLVWMIIGGPLVVVVASIVTMVIAVRSPDPVVEEDYYRKGLNINQTLADEKARQMMPAMQARNHVATPKDEEVGAAKK